MILRRDKTVTVAELCQAVREASRLFCVSEAAELRSIVVRDGEGEWRNFATCLVVGVETLACRDIGMGDVQLVRRIVQPNEIADEASLVSTLMRWKEAVPQEEEPDFQEEFHVSRFWKGNGLTGSPCWYIPLHDRNTNKNHYNTKAVPRGPFFNTEHRMFEDRLGGLAATWTGDPSLRQYDTLQNAYCVVVADKRGQFEKLSYEEGKLVVEVEGGLDKGLFCCVEFYDYDRKTGAEVADVEDRVAEVAVPDDMDSLGLYLMTADGECLDEYRESTHFRSWGDGVVFGGSASVRSIREALATGENEVVEYKDWMPPSGGKSFELVKTVIAFGNTEGGSLLIGVNDDVEVTGVTSKLERFYGQSGGGDIEEMKKTYESNLRKLIKEGIEPSVRPVMEWVEYAGELILRVEVPKGRNAPYSALRNGEVYVRRSGSTRRAKAEEILKMNSRTSQILG